MKLIKYIAIAFLAQLFIATIVTLDTFGQDTLWVKSEIGNYKTASAVNSKNLAVFAGSSSIKLWENLAESFPRKNVWNCGFGGSEMSDLIYYADEAIIRYKPVTAFSQTDNPIIKRIQPVPLQSGFRMSGYWVWGGSVIKVDSVYHMFASRWPKKREFPVDYYESSEIVRATSKSLVGPYKFQEIVIGERDSAFWDSNMAHNPSIYKIDNEYVLFYIGSDFTTMQPGSKNYIRRIGYATASSIEGPWHRCNKPVINEESNNPAVLVDGNKIKLLFRDENLRVFIAEADNFSGPYKIVNDNVWTESELEDFYLFKMDDKYHFICEDGQGAITGHERWGADLYSEDGIHNWIKYKNPVAYDHSIRYNDGSVLHCTRRERPQLIIENNAITGLLTAVYNGKESWCQPVELFPPIEMSNK